MRLLTAEQVAADLAVPKTWVYRAARDGRLPSVQCGRYVRFHPDDVADWVDAQRLGTLDATKESPPRPLERPGGMAQRSKPHEHA